MHRKEIPIYKVEYRQTCPVCDLETLVLSQKDDFPEYQTEVYVQCVCGEFLEFILPVN